MLRRFLLTQQQRSFHQSATTWKYSRTALRRLKKPELVALAGQHQLDASGTKNDIIHRLLTTPTQYTPPISNNNDINNTTVAADSTAEEKPSSGESVDPSASRRPATSDPEASNIKTEAPESINMNLKMSATEETPIYSSSSTTTHSAPSAIMTDSMETNDEEYDHQWVEAFDLKVGNRRSGGSNGLGASGRHERFASLRRQPTSSSSSSSSDTASSSSTHPAYVHQTIGIDPTHNSNPISSSGLSTHRPIITTTTLHKDDDEPMEFTDPEINQHWVKVFDQRVKTRTKIMGMDTLNVHPKSPLEPSPPPIHNDAAPGNHHNNKTIDLAIGSTLAAWYFLGGEGIQAALSSLFS